MFDKAATPERVYEICKIVSKGKIASDDLKEIIEPSIFINSESYYSKILNAAIDELHLLKKLIAFERQDQAVSKSYIVLEDNDDTFNLLLCFGRWMHLGKKSWDFEDSASSVYFATLWLQKNLKTIVQAVKGQLEGNTTVFIKSAMISEIYRKALNGELNSSHGSKINKDIFLKGFERKKNVSVESGHSQQWCDLLNVAYDGTQAEENNKNVHKYFKLIMGIDLDGKKYIFNQSLFNQTLKALKSTDFLIDFDCDYTIDDKSSIKKSTREYCRKIVTKSESVALAEYKKANEVLSKILSYYGYDADSELNIDAKDIRSMLDKVIEFYEKAIHAGVNIKEQKSDAEALKRQAESIEKAANAVQFDYESKSTLEILLLFSDNPIGKLIPFLRILERTSADVDYVIKQKENEKADLNRKGFWEKSVDSRFEQHENDFIALYREIKGV